MAFASNSSAAETQPSLSHENFLTAPSIKCTSFVGYSERTMAHKSSGRVELTFEWLGVATAWLAWTTTAAQASNSMRSHENAYAHGCTLLEVTRNSAR